MVLSRLVVAEMLDARPEIIEACVDGKDGRSPEKGDAHFRHAWHDLVAGRSCEQKGERDHLNRCLPFGKLGNGNADAEFGQKFAQARDKDFPAENDDRGPEGEAGNNVLPGQGDQHDSDEQLVRNRVKHPAEIRLLLPGTGKIAVEKIGNARNDEKRQRNPMRLIAFNVEADDDCGHQRNAEIGQKVWQVRGHIPVNSHVWGDSLSSLADMSRGRWPYSTVYVRISVKMVVNSAGDLRADAVHGFKIGQTRAGDG